MASSEFNLDWLISTHGQFLNRFGNDREKIIAGYRTWNSNNPENSVTDYFRELLRQSCIYISKNADSEEEYYSSKLQLDIKMLEYEAMGKDNKNYLLEQIHFDKLMISRLTLPFKFDVQIESRDCCPYCTKKDKKTYSFEKVLEKKYLPFAKCKNKDGCSCSYSVVPLSDENEKLIAKDR